MNPTTTLRQALLLVLSIFITSSALAQQHPSDIHAAAQRYLRSVPIEPVMDSMVQQLATRLPPDRRAEFASDMKDVIDVKRFEAIMLDAMIKTFTADELNALADFMESKLGSSAMGKMGVYMGHAMPSLMQEIERGVQTLQSKKRR